MIKVEFLTQSGGMIIVIFTITFIAILCWNYFSGLLRKPK